MTRHHGNRARLGGVLLVVALGAAAILALPGVALTKDRDGGGTAKPAGTIASFDPDTHLLAIDLTDGGTIEGLVGRRTHIRCGRVSRRHHRRRARLQRRNRRMHRASVSHSRDRALEREQQDAAGADGPGEDPVGDQPGEDQGDDQPGDDQGDDHGDGGNRRRHHGDRSGRCVDALVEGATVMRAEMVLAHGKAFYKQVGVLPPPAAVTG